MKYTLTQRLTHFYHVVSNIRPTVWIVLYVCVIPIFALIYMWLPQGQFRIPEGDVTNYGSWLYYSIVTVTTLGFGDYTPSHGAAQAVTAVEVMCGLIFLGLFLNAVGSMKSEIDVESEIEKQKRVKHQMEHEKLIKSVPMILHSLNIFLSYCYAVTTPLAKRKSLDPAFNPDFELKDMQDLFKPSGIPSDRTSLPAVERLLQSASRTSLLLDSLQQRIDLTLWPELLEDCFSFVANCQMFSDTAVMFRNPDRIDFGDSGQGVENMERILEKKISSEDDSSMEVDDNQMKDVIKLYDFIKENAGIALKLETLLTELSNEKE